MNLSFRSEEKEIMDDLEVKGDVVIQTLKELDVINRLLGGNQISLGPFKRIASKMDEFSVLDLGCGSAEILKLMAKWARDHNIKGRFVGVDANPLITEYARENTAEFNEIEIVTDNIFNEKWQSPNFDIVHCCLFNHHFDSEENAQFLSGWSKNASHVIINDLQRHAMAYHSIKWLTNLFSKSDMVKYDAKLSVARGFHRHELEEILKEAEIEKYILKWRWAFRWQLVISTPGQDR